MTKDCLSDRVNQLLLPNKIIDKTNRSKDLFSLNEDIINMSIIHMIPYKKTIHPVRFLILRKNLLDSFEPPLSLSRQASFIKTRKRQMTHN